MFKRFWAHSFSSIGGVTVLPSPFEDLTTYDKVDTEGNLTADLHKLTLANLHTVHTTAYLSKDFGVGYFTKDCQINFEFCVTDDTHDAPVDMYGLIALSNTLGIRDDGKLGPVVYWYCGDHGDGNIDISAGDDQYAASETEFLDDPATIYYCTFKRISAVAPADCTIQLGVYTDASRTTRMNSRTGSMSALYGRADIPTVNGLTAFRYLQLGTSERAAVSATPYGSYYIQNVEIVSH